jgi:protein ECT2
MATVVHQFGLFKFSTGSLTTPSTPTANTRSKPSIFSLDAIPRNLFNTRPVVPSKTEFFPGSVSNHARSKSAGSRSSVYTETTSAGDGSVTKFSHRSDSTATAATSISTFEDDVVVPEKTPKSRKLLKRGKSPSARSDGGISPGHGRSRSNSTSRDSSADFSDHNNTALEMDEMDKSEWDLARRLELARRNSQQQDGKPIPPLPPLKPPEETIYEGTWLLLHCNFFPSHRSLDDPPSPVRPASRAAYSHRSITPQPDSPHPRPASAQSSERRPFGPRCPSPLPPKSPEKNNPTGPPIVEAYTGSGSPSLIASHPLPTPPDNSSVSPLPRSKRQPFFPTGNTTTPKTPTANTPVTPSSVEPLSIKKKTSVRSAMIGTPTGRRRSLTTGHSPLSRGPIRVTSPRKVSPQSKLSRARGSMRDSTTNANADTIVRLAQTTKEDVSNLPYCSLETSQVYFRSSQPPVPSSVSKSNWKGFV